MLLPMCRKASQRHPRLRFALPTRRVRIETAHVCVLLALTDILQMPTSSRKHSSRLNRRTKLSSAERRRRRPRRSKWYTHWRAASRQGAATCSPSGRVIGGLSRPGVYNIGMLRRTVCRVPCSILGVHHLSPPSSTSHHHRQPHQHRLVPSEMDLAQHPNHLDHHHSTPMESDRCRWKAE